MRGVTVGLVLAAIALLPACSGESTAAAPQTAVTTTVSSPPASSGSSASSAPVAPDSGPEVNCSAAGTGKVGPAGGSQVDLIAERAAAGIVGCAEAASVIAEYYRTAGSEESDEAVAVQGWTCVADTGDEGTGIVVCEKAGLSFHTGQP